MRAEGKLLTEVPWIFAAPTGANKVTVYWDEVPGATGYRVRWGTVSGSHPNSSAVLPATARQFTVSGLVRNREYYSDGYQRTGSFFEFVGVGYQPLFSIGELPYPAYAYCPPFYQLWTGDISDPPTNFPPVGSVVNATVIEPYFQEYVHINLRR